MLRMVSKMVDFHKLQGSIDGDTITVKSDQLEVRITNKHLAKRVSDRSAVYGWTVGYAIADVLGLDPLTQFLKDAATSLEPQSSDELFFETDMFICHALQWEDASTSVTRDGLVSFYAEPREFADEGIGEWPAEKIKRAIDLGLAGKLVEAYALAKKAAAEFYGD